MSENTFDFAVIGGGPGGYVAAIKGAQLGLKTALVEKSAHLGGTCLNVGCIPSKALLHSTELYQFTAKESQLHGIECKGLSMNLATLMKRKEAVVSRLRMGVRSLVEKRGITIFAGLGRLLGDGVVEIEGASESSRIRAENIVVATGSSAASLPFLPFDGDQIVTSDEAIAFTEVPENLVVVGGGAIGLELGSVWSRLGSAVTILEFLPRIAPTFDSEISRLAERLFKRQGMKIETGARVTGVEKADSVLRVAVEKKEKELTYTADKMLVAVGRVPHTEGLGAKEVGLLLDDQGRIEIDSNFHTNLPGVYAIGDVVKGPMLAHKAEEEGAAVAELVAGNSVCVNTNVIPNVVYTEPEIASVGLGEDEAKQRGIAVRTGRFPLAANGRAIAAGSTDGLVKVVAEAQSDRLLGVQIIGKSASELIAAGVAHMEYCGSAEDMARTIHAHPTLSESLKEAALSVAGVSIHSL